MCYKNHIFVVTVVFLCCFLYPQSRLITLGWCDVGRVVWKSLPYLYLHGIYIPEHSAGQGRS